MSDINVREDLNDIVRKMSLTTIKTKYNERNVCLVTLIDNTVLEFKDKDGLFDLLKSYKKCGKDNMILSKKLVEEIKADKVDTVDEIMDEDKGTYVCVVYELIDGSKYHLFASRFVDLKIIENCYEMYKQSQNKKEKVKV